MAIETGLERASESAATPYGFEAPVVGHEQREHEMKVPAGRLYALVEDEFVVAGYVFGKQAVDLPRRVGDLAILSHLAHAAEGEVGHRVRDETRADVGESLWEVIGDDAAEGRKYEACGGHYVRATDLEGVAVVVVQGRVDAVVGCGRLRGGDVERIDLE